MSKLVFATSNPNKIKEVNELLSNNALVIIGLKDIGCEEEIPETQPTIQGNALQKAEYIYDRYDVDVFSEDTGLEVDALGGAPGVYTARYAGEAKDPQANMNKLLSELADKPNRGAQFRTVISLIRNGQRYFFEGIARGTISLQKQGTEGFGYDPVFIPEGYEQSFAEMTSAEKNKISHRGKAVRKLIDFLALQQS